ncbi:Receptor-type tyrosine-protein phosphatase T [Lamellibrachia satsuma]|nr:Receptor-type tyrosine-protein phosphatase T [Lamellibrachia satsuma]
MERDQIHDGLVSEFKKLPNETSSMFVSKHPVSWIKNRYRNLWTYDHNRVLLDTDDDNPTDYINASHITGYNRRVYVASQGPIRTTVSDMWRLIWQLKTNRVVMLTKLSDCGMNICELYWPSKTGGRKEYGKFRVTTLSCDIYSDYTIRTFLVTCQGHDRKITHFHFTSWVDEGVPKSTYPLLAFRRLVRSFDDHNTGPIIVHCSGGVGRTGTFIALDSLLDQGQADGQVDVFSFACHLRTERMDMVETQEQYVFLHHALLDGLQTGHLAYPVSQYPTVYKRLCVDDAHMAELQKQFQMLETVKPAKPQPMCEVQQTDNQLRRRCHETIPVDNNHPHLSRESPRTSDCVNVVCVDSFRRHDGYLLTQMPLPNTVVDFWRLVLDHNCPTIVILEEVESQESIHYWPGKEDSVKTYGKLTVTLLSEQNSSIEGVIQREFSVYSTAKPKKVHTVKQHQLMTGWPNTDRLPSSTNTILGLIELVNRPVSEDDHSGPVILQCMNGVSHSGLFCAASHLLGSLTVDQYVDVFHSAQHVRNKRPQAIDCVEQYQFLHRLAAEYLSQHTT